MDNIEEKLLDDYMAEFYSECPNMRDAVRETVGFKIHVLSHHHRELGKAILGKMQKSKEQFFKKILGSKTDD